MVNVDTIIDYLTDKVETKEPIPPTLWIDSAVKLNLLLGDEQDRFYKLQQEVAKVKYARISEKMSVAQAKAFSEQTDEYREMMQQRAKIERIIEFIRLAKVQSRISADEMRGY